MAWPTTKVFGGKRYAFVHAYSDRKRADEAAKSMRRDDYRARVVRLESTEGSVAFVLYARRPWFKSYK